MKRLFDELGARYKTQRRYTNHQTRRRKGDNAELAVIEWWITLGISC